VAPFWWRLSYPALGAALLGISFQPWFALSVDGTLPLAYQVDAWRGSTLWTVVVVLGLAAAALGWIATRRSGRRLSLVALSIGILASGLSAWLWARQWWLIDHPPPLRGVVTVAAPSFVEADVVRIERNQLASYASANGLGQRVWITGWSYLGLAVVVVLLAGLVGQLAIGVRQSHTNTGSLPPT
jgi:disulfide bond formation protein DsbB